MNKNFTFMVDTIQPNTLSVARVKQLDTAIFNMTITENGSAKDLTGVKLKLFIRKADGKLVFQESDINITNEKAGKLSVNIHNTAFQCVGIAVAELDITKDGSTIATANFYFDVEEKLGNDDAVKSVIDVPLFDKLTQYISTALAEINKYKGLMEAFTKAGISLEGLVDIKNYIDNNLAGLKAQGDRADKLIPQLDTKNSTAEKLIGGLGTATLSGEAKRVQLVNTTASAEAKRVEVVNTTNTANASKTALEGTTASAEAKKKEVESATASAEAKRIQVVDVTGKAEAKRVEVDNATNTADAKKKEVESATASAEAKRIQVVDVTATAGESKKALDSSIASGNNSKSALDTSKANADASKKALDSSIASGNSVKAGLDSSIGTGNSVKGALDTSTKNAESKRVEVDGATKTAEAKRVEVVGATNTAEAKRVQVVDATGKAESKRVEVVNATNTAEASKTALVSATASADAKKKEVEGATASAESKRAEVVAVTGTANTSKSQLETATATAEAKRVEVVSVTAEAEKKRAEVVSVTGTANASKTALEGSIASGNSVKAGLDSSIGTGNRVKAGLDESIKTGNSVKAGLESATASANSKKNEVVSATNTAEAKRVEVVDVTGKAESKRAELQKIIDSVAQADLVTETAFNNKTGNTYCLMPFYHFEKGVLIDTGIPAGTCSMFTVRLTGNSYQGDTPPIECLYNFYDYLPTEDILSLGGVALGLPISLQVFRHEGKVKLWAKQLHSYQTLTFEITLGNKLDKIVPKGLHAEMPTAGVTCSHTIVPIQVYSPAHKPSPSEIGASPSNHNHDNVYTSKVATRLEGADFNTVTAGGLYATVRNSTEKHAPINADGRLLVMSWSHGNWASQMFFADGGRVFTRTATNIGGTEWTAWTELYTRQSKPTPAEIGALGKMGEIKDSTDFNTITEAGMYKVQGFTAQTPNCPPNCYNFGILVVYKSNISSEDRTLQVYYPHYEGGFKDKIPVTRMKNQDTWTGWSKITKGLTPAEIGASAVGHLHDDRYLQKGSWGTNGGQDLLVHGKRALVGTTDGNLFLGYGGDFQNIFCGNNYHVYHEGHKPSPAEIGALGKTEKAVSAGTADRATSAGNADTVSGKNFVWDWGTGNPTHIWGSSGSATHMQVWSPDSITVGKSKVADSVPWAGVTGKPSLADLGGIAKSGDTMTGDLSFSAGKTLVTANNYGIKGLLSDGSNSDYMLYIGADNRIKLSYSNRPVDIQASDVKIKGSRVLSDIQSSPLWKGYHHMTSKEKITPSKPLSQCNNGWVLVWSDWDNGSTGQNWNFCYSYVPKNTPWKDGHNHDFLVANGEGDRAVSTKCLYINDTFIQGDDSNTKENSYDVVIRAVIEY